MTLLVHSLQYRLYLSEITDHFYVVVGPSRFPGVDPVGSIYICLCHLHKYALYMQLRKLHHSINWCGALPTTDQPGRFRKNVKLQLILITCI